MNWLKNKAYLAAGAVMLASAAMAQEDAVTAESAMQQISEKFTELISSAVPIILALLGSAIAIFAIFAGVKWLKRTLKAGS